MNGAFVKGDPIMGQLDDTSTTAATEDNVAPVRITAQRAFHVNFRNNAGTEIGTSGAPVRVDPTGTTTQPVSAASLPLPTGAATETTLAKLTLTQGSTTSGQSGPLVQGAVTTAAPSYTTAQTSPISLTTAGSLRTDTSSIAGNTVLTGNGTTGTGSQRVTIASDNTPYPIKISDGTDTALVTTNGDQKVVDGLRNGSVYGAVNIPTANTAVEAKIGASRLTNRKFLYITIENNGIFWGYDNTVTTTSGFPTANGQVLTWAIDPDSTFQVWLVGSANNKNVHIGETP